jgi:hypothetical protein
MVRIIKKEDITKINNIDFEKITLKQGGYKNDKMILQYDNKNFYIQMLTYSPFGVSHYKDSKKQSMSINVEDNVKEFLVKLKLKMFELINTKSNLKFLKIKKFNEDMFNNMCNSLYREATNEKYKPLMKLSFVNNYDNNDLNDVLLYNKEKTFINKQFSQAELEKLIGKKTTNNVCIQPFFYKVNKSIGITFKIQILQLKESDELVEKMSDLCLL